MTLACAASWNRVTRPTPSRTNWVFKDSSTVRPLRRAIPENRGARRREDETADNLWACRRRAMADIDFPKPSSSVCARGGESSVEKLHAGVIAGGLSIHRRLMLPTRSVHSTHYAQRFARKKYGVRGGRCLRRRSRSIPPARYRNRRADGRWPAARPDCRRRTPHAAGTGPRRRRSARPGL